MVAALVTIRPTQDRMPVLLVPDGYDHLLHGDFDVLLVFQNRCLPDALSKMTLTTDLWHEPQAAQA